MPESSKDLQVIVIGGSIAGCTIAALLKDIPGITVKVIESSTQLHERGAGIVLPKALLDKCIELRLFNANIPYTVINQRSFWVTESSGELRNIWQQPIALVALNWKDLFDNLRHGVPTENYHARHKVHKIADMGKQVIVDSTLGEEKCDLVISADGVNSFTRTQLYPESKPDYAGYVAYRGMASLSKLKIPKQFQENFHYFVFSDGHLLIFPVPGSKPGEILINWMLYKIYPKEELKSLLIDKNGKSQKISLPRGSLRKDHIEHLHALANKELPPQIAAIVTQTEEPFLQVIVDALAPDFVNGNICGFGDSRLVLRPHSGSGAGHAITFAIALAEVLKNNKSLSLSEMLKQWNQGRVEYAQGQKKLSKNLGDALVINAPDWSKMNQKMMDEWFAGVLAGRPWHVTDHAKDQKSEAPNTLFFLPPKTVSPAGDKLVVANPTSIRLSKL